ncbi:MAG: S-layer homology domain-containing protein [bacterium]
MKKILLFLLIVLGMSGQCFSLVTAEAAVPTVEVVKVNMLTISTPEAAPTPEVARGVQVKLRDVPNDHWAANSVYDLVGMGVTQGYPDGTYRGNNNITRYETAMFLSKLASSIGRSSDDTEIAVEKLKDDLRTEIRSLRADIAELKRMPEEQEEKPISGSYSARIMFGNLIAVNTSIEGQSAPVGPLVRYRLKTTFSKRISESAKLKVNLDTMDSGFGGGSSDLSTRILDVESDLRLNVGLENPVDVKVTSGPGPVVHTEEANAYGSYIARSENNVVYLRPWNSIMLSSKMWGMDLGLGYIAREVSTLGEVEVHQIKAVIGYVFPGMYFVPSFKLNTNVDYLAADIQAKPAGPTDTKLTFDTSYMISPKFKIGMLYGCGHGAYPSNSMVGLQFDMLDMWDSGTMLTFKYRKVGAEYLHENATLNEDLFAGLDVFGRYIGNGGGSGVVDVGGELDQAITENVSIIGRVDWRLASDNSYGSDLSQCMLTLNGGVSWDIATDTLFEALYEVESIPSSTTDTSTDLLQINLSYKY